MIEDRARWSLQLAKDRREAEGVGKPWEENPPIVVLGSGDGESAHLKAAVERMIQNLQTVENNGDEQAPNSKKMKAVSLPSARIWDLMACLLLCGESRQRVYPYVRDEMFRAYHEHFPNAASAGIASA